MDCLFCTDDGGELVYRDDFLRVVLAPEPDYPGFCRVILNAHQREMTDLDPADRERLMRAVFAVEAALREVLWPEKINLASLGNQLPHVHWHVIPRFADDPHFPDPVWATRRRESASNVRASEALQDLRAAIRSRIEHNPP